MKLCLTSQQRDFLLALADAAQPNEITGIGTLKTDGNDLFVGKIFIPEQKVDTSYCEFASGALNDILDDLSDEEISELKFRWHSHVNMNAFFSSTDEKDIEESESDWVVNLVFNVRGEMLARVDMHRPLEIVNIPLEIKIIRDKSLDEEAKKIVDEKCTKRIVIPVYDYRYPRVGGGAYTSYGVGAGATKNVGAGAAKNVGAKTGFKFGKKKGKGVE